MAIGVLLFGARFAEYRFRKEVIWGWAIGVLLFGARFAEYRFRREVIWGLVIGVYMKRNGSIGVSFRWLMD